MASLQIQIRQPDGRVERLSIDSPRVLIGSGAHCDLRLPMNQAAPEHVAISIASAGVYMEALSFDPPPLLNGVAYDQGPLPANGVLTVGQTQFMVSLVGSTMTGPSAAAEEKKASPIGIIVMLVLIAPAAYFLFQSDVVSGPQAEKAPPATALFAPPPANCNGLHGREALAVAQSRYAVASARRERMPFYVQDGILAVPLVELASVCFRDGGDAASAQDLEGQAKRMREDLELDYRTHQVRMEHARATDDLDTVRIEVHVLRQFVTGKTGDYPDYLERIEKGLQVKLGKGAQPS